MSVAGVKLKFLGLNNQNLHNNLFRGFLKPWEDYTGATIEWIDLAQADYNGRIQQANATDTVDWDIMEMGAPFEGDYAGGGLLDPMPDWVADADRHGRLRGLPQGAHRHLGRRHLPDLDRWRLRTPWPTGRTTTTTPISPPHGRLKVTKAIGHRPRRGSRSTSRPSSWPARRTR